MDKVENRLTLIRKLPRIEFIGGRGARKTTNTAIYKCTCGKECERSVKFIEKKGRIGTRIIACDKCVAKHTRDLVRERPCKCGRMYKKHDKCKRCTAMICEHSYCTKPSPSKEFCLGCYNKLKKHLKKN